MLKKLFNPSRIQSRKYPKMEPFRLEKRLSQLKIWIPKEESFGEIFFRKSHTATKPFGLVNGLKLYNNLEVDFSDVVDLLHYDTNPLTSWIKWPFSDIWIKNCPCKSRSFLQKAPTKNWEIYSDVHFDFSTKFRNVITTILSRSWQMSVF